MDDLMIIELYFARNEQAINETDIKYGKLCLNMANNILSDNEDSKECVNDTYLSVWNKIPPTRPDNFMSWNLATIAQQLTLSSIAFTLSSTLYHTQF